jgi:hypothetical protein
LDVYHASQYFIAFTIAREKTKAEKVPQMLKIKPVVAALVSQSVVKTMVPDVVVAVVAVVDNHGTTSTICALALSRRAVDTEHRWGKRIIVVVVDNDRW